MDNNRFESGKFAQVSDLAIGKSLDGIEKALTESASRGFPIPGGDTLNTIITVTQEARKDIVEANGKIYDDRSGQIYQHDETLLNYAVKAARYAMELYREELISAIAIEQAEMQSEIDQGKADVARLNATIEARIASVSMDKAAMQSQIAAAQQEVVDAGLSAVAAEMALQDAKMETATAKLGILESIYDILAAEQLVLVAEQRRVGALETLMAAMLDLAAVKQSMIPLYIQKAAAKTALADATTAEIPVLQAIENLGLLRVQLKAAQEGVHHIERQAQVQHETASQAYHTAQAAYEVAKTNMRVAVLEASNTARTTVAALKQALGIQEANFRPLADLLRTTNVIDAEKALQGLEANSLSQELATLLSNISARGSDEARRVAASGHRSDMHTTTYLFSRQIKGGYV